MGPLGEQFPTVYPKLAASLNGYSNWSIRPEVSQTLANDGANICRFLLQFSDYRQPPGSLIDFPGITCLPPVLGMNWHSGLIGSHLPGFRLISIGRKRDCAFFSSSLNHPSPYTIHCPDGSSWAYLRLAHFKSRPGHADQLHLDLWWRGMNIAMDAGTFSYNNPPPWDNALSTTHVHNTITINGKDQMTRAGQFLWLDWAQAAVVTHDLDLTGRADHCPA
jgi:hypothetical protein